MRKYLVASAALAALSAVSFAADPVEVATPQDWTGFYLGVHAGYGSANNDGIFDSSELPDFPEDATFADDLDANGFLGGAQAGYIWQTGNMFWGVEADASLTDMKDSVGDDDGDDVIKFDLDALASLRLRAGFAADSVLLYATGGVAYASGEFKVIDNLGDATENSGSLDISDFGGVVGGGAALAVSEAMSIRLEGLYYFFDENHDSSDLTDDSDDGDSLSLEDVFVVRAGLDFRL